MPRSQMPQSPRNVPAFNIPPATLWTILMLGGMFLALRIGPQSFSDRLLFYFAFDNRSFETALSSGNIGFLTLFPLLSHGLLHHDAIHLLLNVGLLCAFGSVVERAFGKSLFLAILTLTVIGGALTQSWSSEGRDLIMIGASGGVYGLIGAAIPLLFWSPKGFYWRGGFGFIVVLMLLNLILGPLSGVIDLFGSRIAWQAHIGGFAIGLALGIAIFFLKTSKPSR